jgi:hypothetical protein
MEKNSIEPDSKAFGAAMNWTAVVGLLVIGGGAILYLSGFYQYLSLNATLCHWEKPVSIFWTEIKDIETPGYSFFRHPGYSDCICLIGVAILASAPLFGLAFALPKSRKIHKILISVLIVELIFAMTRQLLFSGG